MSAAPLAVPDPLAKAHEHSHAISSQDTETGAKGDAPAPAFNAKRVWFRSTFTQATILGICSFLAPGLWGAMNSLGAGGAREFRVGLLFTTSFGASEGVC